MHENLQNVLLVNLLAGYFELKMPQPNRSLDVGSFLKMETYPPTLRKNVMRFDTMRGDQLIPNFHRKRDVQQGVAMNVTEFLEQVRQLFLLLFC